MLSSFHRLWRYVIGTVGRLPLAFTVFRLIASGRIGNINPTAAKTWVEKCLQEEDWVLRSEYDRYIGLVTEDRDTLKADNNFLRARAQLAEETNADNITQGRMALDEKDRQIEYLKLQLGAAEAHALEQQMVIDADAAEHARDAQALIEARATIRQMEGDAAVLNGISEQKQDRIDRLVAAHKSLCAELRDAKEILRLVKSVVLKDPTGEPETATVHITRRQWEPNPILDTTRCGEGE